jgi:predicted GNAT family N-acyltransferase
MEYTLVKNRLPQGAEAVRRAVFMEEQGFTVEFDEIDQRAFHGLLTEGGKPIATFRLFRGREPGIYILGRVCVVREKRHLHLGTLLLQHAEAEALKEGAREIRLCAQVRASHFYETQGYASYGPIADQEGVPHQWMKKSLVQ